MATRFSKEFKSRQKVFLSKKRIDNKIFYGSGSENNKIDAIQIAKNMRKAGFLVRVIKTRYRYDIYYRKGKK